MHQRYRVQCGNSTPFELGLNRYRAQILKHQETLEFAPRHQLAANHSVLTALIKGTGFSWSPDNEKQAAQVPPTARASMKTASETQPTKDRVFDVSLLLEKVVQDFNSLRANTKSILNSWLGYDIKIGNVVIYREYKLFDFVWGKINDYGFGSVERIINWYKEEPQQNRLANVILKDDALITELNLDHPNNLRYDPNTGLDYVAVAKVAILVFADHIYDTYIDVAGSWQQNLWNTVMSIIGKPGATLVDFVSELWTMSTTALQTIKDGVTSFVDGVKFAGEFFVNKVIKPIMEGLISIFRNVVNALFLTLGETSPGYNTVLIPNGLRLTSYIDNKVLDITIELVGVSTMKMVVGGKTTTVDLFQTILELIIGSETLSPAGSSADSLVWAQGIGLSLLNAAYIASALSQKTNGAVPVLGPLGATLTSLGLFIASQAVLLLTFINIFRERNRYLFADVNLNPWTKEDLDEFDKLMVGWLSALIFVLPFSYTVYNAGKAVKTIVKEGKNGFKKVLEEFAKENKLTAKTSLAKLLYIFISSYNDFKDNVIDNPLTPTMYFWLAGVASGEIVSYAVLDKFGKGDPQAAATFFSKKGYSLVVLPFLFFIFKEVLKLFSSVV